MDADAVVPTRPAITNPVISMVACGTYAKGIDNPTSFTRTPKNTPITDAFQVKINAPAEPIRTANTVIMKKTDKLFHKIPVKLTVFVA